jgi:hypothetical protein
MLFNADWFFGPEFEERLAEARRRCALAHHPALESGKADGNKDFKDFVGQLETRTVIYLRDGFSYEVKELIPRKTTTSLTFECTPTDEAYKVGSFVVTIPYDDIIRVEIFAFHPREKPEDMPAIKGFGGPHAAPSRPKRGEERPPRLEAAD